MVDFSTFSDTVITTLPDDWLSEVDSRVNDKKPQDVATFTAILEEYEDEVLCNIGMDQYIAQQENDGTKNK